MRDTERARASAVRSGSRNDVSVKRMRKFASVAWPARSEKAKTVSHPTGRSTRRHSAAPNSAMVAPAMSGVPSVGYTISTGSPFSLSWKRLLVAVRHDGPLAEGEALGRIRGRLHLHHLLLGELLEVVPADVAGDLEGGGEDGAAV